MEVYVPDKSSIINGSLKELVAENKLRGRIIIHSKLLDYFQQLAREGKSEGMIGLRELKELLEVASRSEEVVIEYLRDLPQNLRYTNDVDVIIREIARDLDATLVTCDPVMRAVAEASGIKCLFIRREVPPKLTLEKFFEVLENTLSVHLKEGVAPLAKVGSPGSWRLVKIRDTPMSREELEFIERELVEYVRGGKQDAFIEIEKPGLTVIQYRNYRIVIVKPPVSDGYEITAVKPLVKKRLEDYNLPEKVIKRLETRAEGILISGPPGAGKTTFAQALAEFYMRKGKIVKTIESPRDMVLPPEVTQYSKNFASSEDLHDILLLSRPDYTVYDELRDTRDFEIYVDLRLAGIGMIGVIHATSPIDAIQRFIGRVELGMIPSIIDTVIFIRGGRVEKIYSLEMTVKVPVGLKEEELARPVVVVKDFITETPEYEIYVFGEQTFVVPVKRIEAGKNVRYAVAYIMKYLRKYVPREEIDVEVTSPDTVTIYVPAPLADRLAIRLAPRIEKAEKKYGVTIRIMPR